MCPHPRRFGVRWGEEEENLGEVRGKVEKRGTYSDGTSVFFAGIDPRERFEFIWGGQILHWVELELGLKVICQRRM